jgi:hypothetical protein
MNQAVGKPYKSQQLTPENRVFFVKVTVTRRPTNNPTLKEPDTANGPYPEPDESSPHHNNHKAKVIHERIVV